MTDKQKPEREEPLACGRLCPDDREIISTMTLEQIAEEFDLPKWLLVRAIETVCMTQTAIRDYKQKLYNESLQAEKSSE